MEKAIFGLLPSTWCYWRVQSTGPRDVTLPQGKVAKLMGVASGSVKAWRERYA